MAVCARPTKYNLHFFLRVFVISAWEKNAVDHSLIRTVKDFVLLATNG